ncbi:MAG: imidazole glycerol phosphate synthase subunit HisH [Pseudomonadota bacterium]|nr:imidazole glycerol phosphate synthase subunit HisH [Pseudomonadota bacterium]
MSANVVIIDSGGANIASLKFALERIGGLCELTSDPATIEKASRVILPGVGAADDAMQKLRSKGLDRLLQTLKQPVLGICLGMQLLMEASDEDNVECLGIINGKARLFDTSPETPVPHMGWNDLKISNRSKLLKGINDGSYFYFVHSFAIDLIPATIAISDYGRNFSAVIQQENFMGTQFHPERSGPHGSLLLQNFLRMSADDF